MTSSDPIASPSGPEPPPERRVHYWFQHHCHPAPGSAVHRLLEHVIDVSAGVAAWLELDERERPKPPPDDPPPATARTPDAALRGLCVAALELVGDQARRVVGRSAAQPLPAADGRPRPVMPPR